MKTQPPAVSGTFAATYKLTEPYQDLGDSTDQGDEGVVEVELVEENTLRGFHGQAQRVVVQHGRQHLEQKYRKVNQICFEKCLKTWFELLSWCERVCLNHFD